MLAWTISIASINRVAAWVIGARNTLRAVLMGLLEPLEQLRQLEQAGDFTARLALQEELKGLPFGAVWDYHCLSQGVPVGLSYLDEIRPLRNRCARATPVSCEDSEFIYTDSAATETIAGIVELATAAEVQAGTDTGRVPSVSFLRGGLLVSRTAIATTSGTSHDFTGIPSWVKRITVMLHGVSTNGTSNLILQLGDSGGIEVTGYLANSTNISVSPTTSSYTSGFGVITGAASVVCSGVVYITLLDNATNTWVAQGILAKTDGVASSTVAGGKSLSAVLDRIRLTTVNGTDVFDAGTFNIIYE